nr:hypothetical protein [Tanacetum cinerariifolium]
MIHLSLRSSSMNSLTSYLRRSSPVPFHYSRNLEDSCLRILSSKSQVPQLQLGIITNIVNAPREPFIVKQDHGVNSAQNPPHINECCYECGDALDGIFCQQCVRWNFLSTMHLSNSLQDNIIYGLPPCSAVTPNEPVDSLSMRDEHLDTIPATESDEFIKSCVEKLVPNPSESEGENGCDVPSCFTTFSNILFDADYDFESVDDQSLHNEDVSEKIFSNPLFDEEIISIRIDQHHFNAESDLVESMLNRDSSVISHSSKIDSLLDEFVVPCVSKPNFVDESSNIFNPPPQPHINSCEFYGSNAQYGHYCTPQA